VGTGLRMPPVVEGQSPPRRNPRAATGLPFGSLGSTRSRQRCERVRDGRISGSGKRSADGGSHASLSVLPRGMQGCTSLLGMAGSFPPGLHPSTAAVPPSMAPTTPGMRTADDAPERAHWNHPPAALLLQCHACPRGNLNAHRAVGPREAERGEY
jgi:hypothetical protein